MADFRIDVADQIVAELVDAGIRLAVTLPDRWLSGIFGAIRKNERLRQLPVASEPEGVGICAGAYFGGVGSCLVMANAGLMLCAYALPTLATMHRIPLFMLVSYRGLFEDAAFYQEQQGLVTEPLLKAMRVEYAVVSEPKDVGVICEVYRYGRLHRVPTAVLLTRSVLLS